MNRLYLNVVTIVVLICCSSTVLHAQDSTKTKKLRPFRIGAKIGFPNAIGGHVEYVTPLLNKRLAPSIDYTSLKLDSYLDPDRATVKYFEAGLNYYFGKRPGRGIYAHLGYGNFKGKLVTEFYDSFDTGENTRTETYEIDHGSVNIRIGTKAGGLFYFRPEIGYMFSTLPKTIDILIENSDGSSEVETEEMPGILSSGLMFNFGIGFAF